MKSRYKLLIIMSIVVLIMMFTFLKGKAVSDNGIQVTQETIKPEKGDIQIKISTTGTIKPQNRLVLQPPISGKIEKVLVKEGDEVTEGEIIAWMSSTDRAALLDAARAKGTEELAYWEDVYKPTPLIAPMEGTVIVRSVEPGQTVTTSDEVIVLSDQLVVEADVDETDIGSVKKGQRANVTLDAYPDIQIEGTVEHLSYESTIVNNVTIYKVDIIPDNIPDVFRSGMSANVEIIVKESKGALRIPFAAVQNDEKGNYVYLKDKEEKIKQRIEVGASDGEYIEVLSGLTLNDDVLREVKKYGIGKQEKATTNPFMPKFNRKKK